MDEDKKKEILFNDNFTCAKCGYYSPMGDGLEISKNFNKILCSICNTFAPIENKAVFEKYLQEKLEWQILETFRNSGVNRGLHLSQKQGMLEKSRQGLLMARPPFGYLVFHMQNFFSVQNFNGLFPILFQANNTDFAHSYWLRTYHLKSRKQFFSKNLKKLF